MKNSIKNVILFVILIISVMFAITFGNANISIKDVYSVVLGSIKEGAIYNVVWYIRLPRVLLAVFVGIGLSISGLVMQSLVCNSLADPYVLGISSGAYFGVTLGMILGLSKIFGVNFMGVMAFFGALGISVLVIFIANLGGNANTSKLILSGIAISAICSSFSNAMLYFLNNKEAMVEVMFWTMGSLASAKWKVVIVVAPIMLIGTLYFYTQYRNLNILLLGDETAKTLGINIRKIRNIYMLVASFMIGFAVYSAGTIGFIGLIIPHITRIIFGSNHKDNLIPCALFGGIFLVWADVFCRSILKNAELPLGIFVSLIGAPWFLYLLIKNTYGFGDN